MPAVIALVVLLIAVVVVWITVVHGSANQASSINCTPPPSGKSAGSTLDPTALDKTTPLAPDQIQVRVLNAAKQRGQAGIVTAMLGQLGFDKTGQPDNDSVYANSSMDCRAQIRFGKSGAGAARTVSLLDPCSQLVRDSRKDASVDFVLGNKFDDLRPNDAAQKVLKQISSAANRSGQQSQPGQAAAAGDAGIDPNLLKQAHDRSNCGT
jgi:hypothetical protein